MINLTNSVKDYLIDENYNRCFWLHMKNGDVIWSYISQDVPDDPIRFFSERGWDADPVNVEDILKVGEICSFDDDPNNFEGEDYDVNMDYNTLDKFKTSISDTYFYDSMEELDEIIKALNNPIVSDTGRDNDYKVGLIKSYGLVFYWSKYDDFSCGNPFTPYCKIIDGGSVL